jgi:hypothetical protein
VGYTITPPSIKTTTTTSYISTPFPASREIYLDTEEYQLDNPLVFSQTNNASILSSKTNDVTNGKTSMWAFVAATNSHGKNYARTRGLSDIDATVTLTWKARFTGG